MCVCVCVRACVRACGCCCCCCCCCFFRTENKSSRDLADLSANAYRNKRQGRGFWADVEVHTVQDRLLTPGSR